MPCYSLTIKPDDRDRFVELLWAAERKIDQINDEDLGQCEELQRQRIMQLVKAEKIEQKPLPREIPRAKTSSPASRRNKILKTYGGFLVAALATFLIKTHLLEVQDPFLVEKGVVFSWLDCSLRIFQSQGSSVTEIEASSGVYTFNQENEPTISLKCHQPVYVSILEKKGDRWQPVIDHTFREDGNTLLPPESADSLPEFSK